MKKLIINADDFGLTPGVNLGIIESHTQGILTSTTLMANMFGFEHAVQLAKEHPTLGVGVHLVLTAGKPLTKSSSLVDEEDNFLKLPYYETVFNIDFEELYMEWKAQIDKVINAGIVPTHLDSHHHIHTVNGIEDVFIRLAREYQLPVRNNFKVADDIKTVDKFILEFDSLTQSSSIWEPLFFHNLLIDFQHSDTIELMCHPGLIDAELMRTSGLVENRPLVCQLLKEEKFKSFIAKENISLVTYRDV